MFKYLTCVTALLLSFFSTGALAKDFSGFSVFGTLSNQTTTIELAEGGDNLGLGATDRAFDIGADYGFAISSDAVLLVGGTWQISGPELFSFNGTSGLGTAFKFESDEEWTLFVAPGIKFNDSTLVYGKLSHHSMTVKATGDIVGDEDFDGLGYGVGVRIAVGEMGFLVLEAMQVDYDTVTALGANWHPEKTVATVGFGINF